VTGSPYSDLDRPPLNADALRRALLAPDGGLWTGIDVRAETDSTNVDAADAARAGQPEGVVVVAERQRAGRGRHGRAWTSPPRAGITASVLLRPGEAVPGRGWPPAPLSRYGWLPLLAGVALVEAVRRVAEVEAVLKWPNDLLVPVPVVADPPPGGSAGGGHAKCAGILVESVPGYAGSPPAVVVGVGLNVSLRPHELPPGVGGLPVTSLHLAGAAMADRDPLLRSLLRSLAAWYGRWREAAGEPADSGLRAAYLVACATIGTPVRVLLPSGGEIIGTATGVDDDGRLRVRTAGGDRSVSAGDVLHVR
jgi:BirA family biotin operon repressor/biotin-[acetyl-CoA-carboxylase] ligase